MIIKFRHRPWKHNLKWKRDSKTVSTLHQEVKAAKECWWWVAQSPPGKSTKVAYSTPNGNGQPWKHERKWHFKLWAGYIDLLRHTYDSDNK